MMEKRIIRVGVPYGRTHFFLEHGRQRGVSAELVREFERWFNARERRARTLQGRPISVALVPVTRDQLLPALLEGRIDIAGGSLTATPERRAQADFITTTTVRPVSEIIVTGPGAPSLESIDDLAGMTIHSRRSTSYWTSLERLNGRFRAEGRPEMNIVALPDALEDEDKLDMINAGILQVTVIDDWLARAWSPALPDVTLREDLVISSGERSGWADPQGQSAAVGRAAAVLHRGRAAGEPGARAAQPAEHPHPRLLQQRRARGARPVQPDDRPVPQVRRSSTGSTR